jgi:hypothetical protein
MRLLFALVTLSLTACSNDVDPRVIPGGGVGDGEIDGEINVAVIDSSTDAIITGATVDVGGKQKTTDSKGFATFSDVSGKQTVAVKMTGYRSAVEVGVNGANVTIGLQPTTTTVPHATLAGTLTGWDAITVPQGHAKAAAVLVSQTDNIGDVSVDGGSGNFCIAGTTCDWTVISRVGTVTVMAVILDRDLNGTLTDPNDDTSKIIGWAYKTGVVVADGVNQSGLALAQVEAGNLETITVDNGTPPPSLTDLTTIVGIEAGKDDVVQLPLFIESKTATTMLAPKRTLFGDKATYRLTTIAQTTSGDMGAQAVILRQGLTSPNLAAGTWLIPPTSVVATRTNASWEPVSGAKAHSVEWKDAQGVGLLEITVFDLKTKAVDVPSLVALPTSGTLSARVQAIGADFDINDFSLEDDSDLLWGVSGQPATIP